MPTNLSDASLLSRVTLERFVGTFFSKNFFRLSNWKFSLTSLPCLQICLLCLYLVVSHQRFVGTFFFQKIFPTFGPKIFLDLCAMPTNLSAVSLLSSFTSEICRHFFFEKIFDLHFARNDDFQLFPRTVELTTFSCSRWPRTPKIGRYRAIYTPFSIRTFRSFTDTMVMPKKCRLSTRILRELTIFSYFPALLNWKPFYVPDSLEPRNWA